MLNKIDHIGIAVKDLDEAVAFYRDRLGLTLQTVEVIPSRGLKIAFFKLGEVLIELLAPLSDSSEISKFIEKRGQGIHHIAMATDSMDVDSHRLKRQGVRLLSEKPSIGAEGFPINFIHPKDTKSGVLLELIEKG
jgi:methylmalonyl-CoA epimerase